MRSRLVAIFACIVLANVVNYALGEWLDKQIPNWAPPVAQADGSTLNTSRFFVQRPDTSLALSADQETLLDFYTWLDGGGKVSYDNWRSASTNLTTVSTPFLKRALELADGNNAGRYLSLLLLAITVLLIWGKALKESSWLTPILYLGITLGTTALFGGLSSPLFTGTLAGSYVLYFAGLRLFLPVFNTEWCRMMRPFLTLQLFLLAIMAFRGPELVDYWFWTSPLFRLGLVLVLLLTILFHFSIVASVLKKGELGTIARYFAYGMPLGFMLSILGLFLGYYGGESGLSIRELNYELVLFTPKTVAGFNPEAPFLLTGAGILLGVISGIGYSIQRIAR